MENVFIGSLYVPSKYEASDFNNKFSRINQFKIVEAQSLASLYDSDLLEQLIAEK